MNALLLEMAFFLRVAAPVVSLSGGELSFSHRSLSTLFHFVRILSANPPMCATCFFARVISGVCLLLYFRALSTESIGIRGRVDAGGEANFSQ